jgi:hypothetical protein
MRAEEFQLKRFRVTSELRFAKHLAVRGVERCQGAAAEADEETFGCRMVPDIVRIVAELDRFGRVIVARVDELDAFTLAVRHGDELCVGDDRNALRLPEPGQAFDVAVVLQIEDFDGVVPERRDVQSLRGRVDGQVIDSSFDAREIDRADKRQRCLT